MTAPRAEATGGAASAQAGSTGAIRERSGADTRGDQVGGIDRALLDGQGRWDELWKSEETMGGRAALPDDLAKITRCVHHASKGWQLWADYAVTRRSDIYQSEAPSPRFSSCQTACPPHFSPHSRNTSRKHPFSG